MWESEEHDREMILHHFWNLLIVQTLCRTAQEGGDTSEIPGRFSIARTRENGSRSRIESLLRTGRYRKALSSVGGDSEFDYLMS